nr:MAG TPA: hypothetical protein [Caudoviricetes sp.]
MRAGLIETSFFLLIYISLYRSDYIFILYPITRL